ncbi:SDR family oxidoreductase [Vitiosangium sp. GDMCC 1.1324]|uniref:SDR family oxidoreductase n=1 Tax=Vitiosangium sp. (strain GDMCC 1.1324) TaxID=2138576 RepID=UPI000D335AE5|nr:SDR family oxidoreductase [Vitiosangium sp. GDMCC 1.1324]PTL85146.1 NAD(P)-dependent oxidoreductase [Vitiosangium sp. GDMCC 1.1324]
MQTLQGWTALVTGASSGIGEACALALSQAGARLVLAGRRSDRLEALAAKLQTPSHPLILDVRSRQDVEASLAALPPDFANVDVLVNNAGLGLGLEPAHEASLDDWETMIDTNCKGLVYVTRTLLPGMVRRNRGHVVNLGSIAATYPYPGGNVYGATKAFVHQFSQNLKADLVGTRVRVTDVQPGMVETEFSVVRFKGDAQRANKVYEGMEPLTAADIADIVLWTVTRPAHVNINVVEVMPADQGFGPFAVKRR